MEERTDAELIEEARRLLGDRLPPDWTVTAVEGQGAGGEGDALFMFSPHPDGGGGTAIVEARRQFAAADVDRLLGGLTRRLRQASGHQPILLVSEFLSPRTCQLLTEEDISYLDMTGNLRLVLRNPPLFVETTGSARRPPQARQKRSTGLTGARVWRVVRFLAEVDPPYGVTDIEQATGISRGYVSRILERLQEEALIDREPRGPVERVDWPALLRMRGESVDVFKASTTRTYVAASGAGAVLELLAGSALADDLVVTGSFAAVRVAPVAAPALLVLYLDPLTRRLPFFDEVAASLHLLPADEGADVALLWPSNESVVQDPRHSEGLRLVNYPQLAVDCLGGTGRMPAEGEAVLEWMQAHEDTWRFPSIEEHARHRQEEVL